MDLNTAEKKAYFHFRSVQHNVVTGCTVVIVTRRAKLCALPLSSIFFMGALSVKFDWMGFL